MNHSVIILTEIWGGGSCCMTLPAYQMDGECDFVLDKRYILEYILCKMYLTQYFNEGARQ